MRRQGRMADGDEDGGRIEEGDEDGGSRQNGRRE